MEPIISPVLIYLANLSGVLSVMICLIGLFGCIVMLIVTPCVFFEMFARHKDDFKNCMKIIIPLDIIFPMILLIGIVLPSETTCYKMIAAQMITSNNIEKAVKSGKAFKNEIKKDIIDLINEIGKEKTKDK